MHIKSREGEDQSLQTKALRLKYLLMKPKKKCKKLVNFGGVSCSSRMDGSKVSIFISFL